MTHENSITQEVIDEVQHAIHAASQDYFHWSNGNILYDKGVEMLMQVYSAKRLFELFSQRQYKVTVHLARIMQRFDGYTGRGGSIA